MAEFQNSGPMATRSFEVLDRFFLKHLAGSDLIYDHGCGYGAWTDHISRITGARMAIFDPDQDAYAYTKSLLGDRLSESEGPFDAIMCFAVLELLEEAEQSQLLETFRAQLKRKLIVQYNVYNPLSPRWAALRVARGDTMQWHEKNRFHRSYLKPRQVLKLFDAAGFQVVGTCTPAIENHLPKKINEIFGPMVPNMFHSTIYYALEAK